MRVGDRVRSLRGERGLTLEQLARAARVGKGFLCEIEQGLALPSLTTLARVAAALGVRLVDLLALVDAPVRPTARRRRAR